MTDSILVPLGSAIQQDSYTGPKGELTCDENNLDLRLHDGVTPGGRHILNRDNSDLRYQRKSTELAGLLTFEPQQFGFLARLGPANYRLRSFTWNVANLTIVNPSGAEGNPFISLAATITSEHTWSGQQLFEEVCEFSAGINADSAGTHTGPVIGNVTGNLTGDVTGDLLGNSEGNHTGGLDMRGADFFADDGQIPLSALDGLLAYVKLHGFPAGAIVDWSGLESAIPSGWFLCNGLNGTPDLRNRFIVGAGTGGDYDPGDAGGFASVSPAVTIQSSGAHTHALSGNVATAATGVLLNKTIAQPENEQHQVDVVSNVTLSDPGHTHAQGGTADSGGAHVHTATTTPADNRPPYYALCKIMKG